ncbi:DUF3307 domain-containing protein [Wenzhouxiangella sp. EGI_FJ10305]|uniref:DUF3307 domain-containing protein n=1 Tax=Wenzhouxiangella sp. EGI_FJ10305 TaxID=3243768 RepID=UPI0035E0F079
MQILLALLIAHLVGDFVVQRKAVIDGKREGRWPALLEHGAWHLACLTLAWLLFAPAGVAVWQVALAFTGIVVLHLLTDLAKCRWGAGRPLSAFLVDQAIHVATLLVAAWWLAGRPDVIGELNTIWSLTSPVLGWWLVAYLVVVVACGWLNRVALQSLLPDSELEDAGLERAGLYIGWLERFLMFSAFLAEAWAAIGLVLAAKSVFRFESIREQRAHAEYFVVGTLLSVSEVVIVGAVARVAAP